MSLKFLSNENLDEQLKSLVVRERKLLAEIILHIEEVDRRKMYLGMAYPNLFEYLTKHLGYSDGSAQRRIDAARLVKDVPSLPEKLKSGDLSLAQVTLVQKSIRQMNQKVSKETKQSLIEELSGLSFKESQKTVAVTLDIEIKETPKVQIQKDESVRLEVTFSKADWETMEQFRELYSNSLPHGSWDQALLFMAKKMIEKKTHMRSERIKDSPNVTTAKKKTNQRTYQCCQFVDEVTGRKCATRWYLENDHIQSQWAGGSNDIENLQILCANHNKYKYRQEAGLS